MYRYSVDNAVTYTPDDFILFRESPFAVWMERLTLENPGHGSVPDPGSSPPIEDIQPQDEIVDSLRDEGRDVVLVSWDQQESQRRADTLDAMSSGADFIVNGRLALGPMSADANLLMRTSGYSEFGDFLYIPCDTQSHDTLEAGFRLCFLADLLHSLQGQLPPQMLLIRGDADVVPLQTEDHIHYYRAVKKRFMDAMGDFRKHRMPDPGESAHFGRWSLCAMETLKRRAANPDDEGQEAADLDEGVVAADEALLPESIAGEAIEALGEEIETLEIEEPLVAAPLAQAAAGGGLDVVVPGPGATAESLTVPAGRAEGAPTLIEQARMLSPDAFRERRAPGQTPNLARFPRLVKDDNGLVDDPQALAQEPGPEQVPEQGLGQGPEQVPEQAPEAMPASGQAQETERVRETESGREPEVLATAAAAAETAQAGATQQLQSVEEQPEPAAAETARELAGVDSDAPVQPVPAPRAGAEPDAFIGRRGDAVIPARISEFADEALRDLAFIGSTRPSPLYDSSSTGQVVDENLSSPPRREQRSSAPRERRVLSEPKIAGYDVELIDFDGVEFSPGDPHLLPPDARGHCEARDATEEPYEDPLADFQDDAMVDLDSAPPPTLMPVTLGQEPDLTPPADTDRNAAGPGHAGRDATPRREPDAPAPPGFSSSLITNEDYDSTP